MGLYLPSTGTLGYAVWPGAGIICSQGVPPDFYPPHVTVGVAAASPHCTASAHLTAHLHISTLLPVSAASLSLCCWTFTPFNFLTVLVICFEIHLYFFFLWLHEEVNLVYLHLHLKEPFLKKILLVKPPIFLSC